VSKKSGLSESAAYCSAVPRIGLKSGRASDMSNSAGVVLTMIFGAGWSGRAGGVFVGGGESAATSAGALCSKDHGPLIESAVNHWLPPERKNLWLALSRTISAGVLTTRSKDEPVSG
jgi:hypothetical protein